MHIQRASFVMFVVSVLTSLPFGTTIAGNDYCCSCPVGNMKCYSGIGGEVGRIECGVTHPGCGISFYDPPVCRDPRPGLPAPRPLPKGVIDSLSKGIPILATYMYGDDADKGGLGQCNAGGYGRLYAELNTWTREVRHDEDSRYGGCRQGWTI